MSTDMMLQQRNGKPVSRLIKHLIMLPPPPAYSPEHQASRLRPLHPPNFTSLTPCCLRCHLGLSPVCPQERRPCLCTNVAALAGVSPIGNCHTATFTSHRVTDHVSEAGSGAPVIHPPKKQQDLGRASWDTSSGEGVAAVVSLPAAQVFLAGQRNPAPHIYLPTTHRGSLDGEDGRNKGQEQMRISYNYLLYEICGAVK